MILDERRGRIRKSQTVSRTHKLKLVLVEREREREWQLYNDMHKCSKHLVYLHTNTHTHTLVFYPTNWRTNWQSITMITSCVPEHVSLNVKLCRYLLKYDYLHVKLHLCLLSYWECVIFLVSHTFYSCVCHQISWRCVCLDMRFF